MLSLVVFLISAQLVVLCDSFQKSFVHHLSNCNYNLRAKPSSKLSMTGFDKSGDGMDSSKVPVLSPELLAQFQDAIETMVTTQSISTAAYYMTEFHDDITMKWMISFNDYKKTGFEVKPWRSFIEEMIVKDVENITVYLTPPEPFRGAKTSTSPASNVKLQYIHTLAPRKIAHQILTIREDIGGELMEDLRCVKLENAEVERFSSDWMLLGREAAERNRHLTRNTDNEESTPLRNKNYQQCVVFITNFALDLTKQQLNKKSRLGASFLDSVLAKLDRQAEEKDPIDRLLHEPQGPCFLLEELYHYGITQGVAVNEAGESLNVLQMAQEIIALRIALASIASKTLADLATNSRQYYKMIKDHGGFSKLDFGKAAFSLVDMKKVQASDAAEEARHIAEEKRVEEAKKAAEAIKAKLELMPAPLRAQPSPKDKEEGVLVLADADESNIMATAPEDFGSAPMMM